MNAAFANFAENQKARRLASNGTYFTLPTGGSDAVAAGEGGSFWQVFCNFQRRTLPARSSRPSQREGDFLKVRACDLAPWIAVLMAVLSGLSPVDGQEIEQVLQHTDAQTSTLIRIDPAAFDALIETNKVSDQDREQTVLQLRLKQTLELLDGDPIWLTVGFPQTPLSIQILVHDPDGKRIETLKALWDLPSRYPYGTEPLVTVRDLSKPDSDRSAYPARLAEWKKLLASHPDARQGPIQFAFLPPAHLYDTYRELVTELPDYLGGGPIEILTEGLQSGNGSIDPKTGALKGVIESASSEAAATFAERAQQLLKRLSRETNGGKNSRRMDPLIEQLGRSSFQSVESEIHCEIPASPDWQATKMLELAFGSSANRSVMKRLRILSLGILNYESARQYFPPPADSRGPDGPTGLSWRVHILPFIEENELYQKFALDEPWDSPTNIKLLPAMPDVYSEYGSKLFAPANSPPGHTTVVAPISENTILGSPNRVTFSAIVDGSSNTILLVNVEESHAVPWTAPQDYVFEPEQPASGLKFTDGKTPVAFCDGSTRQLLEDNNWVNLFEMNDRQVVQPK